MDQNELSTDEIEKLRELLRYGEEFQEMMVLRGAKAVLFRTYRTAIIGTAGLLVAIFTLWDSFKALLRSMIQ